METHSIKISAIDDKPDVFIQKELISNPYTKYMLILNVSVDGDAKLFETARKKYSVTAPRARILLVYYDA